MMRIQCKLNDNIESIKDQIMDIMNDYLQDNDGKLINVKVLPNNQICIYFVTGLDTNDVQWEQQLIRGPLSQFKVLPNSIEIRPSR